MLPGVHLSSMEARRFDKSTRIGEGRYDSITQFTKIYSPGRVRFLALRQLTGSPHLDFEDSPQTNNELEIIG